ncbi:MAG TPA: hypothetical protein PLR86_06845 [Planctomycetota bacterium]|nr:hypothetical protein [Planctomycetota bacterium]
MLWGQNYIIFIVYLSNKNKKAIHFLMFSCSGEAKLLGGGKCCSGESKLALGRKVALGNVSCSVALLSCSGEAILLWGGNVARGRQICSGVAMLLGGSNENA